MPHLNRAALASLNAAVARPNYDLDAHRRVIVHFGVGGFHRSHFAGYLHDLRQAGDLTWTLCGVGVRDGDAAMRDVLERQDCLYTLQTIAPDGTLQTGIIGAISRYHYAPDDPAAVLELLADPATGIVSLTITEGGYEVDETTGTFEPQHPATVADLAALRAGERTPPSSVLGHLVAGLGLRRARGVGPFTVMSCDNIQHNGQIARTAVLGFAAAADPELAEWIAEEVAFPSSMVDRITPVTTDADRAAIGELLGVTDGWPVRAETFRQWVLEDWFVAGRPALERVGVQLVDDVDAYEQLKLRLLNASHQVMSHLGLLAGLEYVHEACADPIIAQFVRRYLAAEAAPTLPPVPGVDLEDYQRVLMARFASPAVADTLARQVVDSSDRIAKFLLPVVRDCLADRGPIGCAALVLAAWAQRIAAAGAQGTDLTDRRAGQLIEAVAADEARPGTFLDAGWLFGELGSDRRLRRAYCRAREVLRKSGPRAAIRAALDEGRQTPGNDQQTHWNE